MMIMRTCRARGMHRRIFFFLLLPAVLLFLNVETCNATDAASEKVLLSLDEMIRIALVNNPQVDSAGEQKVQRQGQLTQARASYLPQATITGDYGRLRIEDLQPTDEDNIAHGGASVRQLIYDFGRTSGAIDAGQSNLEASDANLNQVEQNIMLLVKQAYYNVLEKKHLIKVYEEAVTNYEQFLYQAKEFFQAGVRTRIDVVNAEVELSSSRLRLLQGQYDLKSARIELERILGIVPYDGNYDPVPILHNLDRVDAQMPHLPGPLAQLLLLAEEHRQDIRQQKAIIKTAEAYIRQADSGYWPSVGAIAGVDSYDTDLTAFSDQWNVGVALTWEIFSGFRTRGEVAEAKALHRENQFRLHELELFVTQEVTDNLLRADESRESVLLNIETVGLAAENLELASERYKAGLSDIIEYNDAQLRHTTARGDLISSYFSYLTSLARIDYSIGTPAPEIAEAE